MLYQLFKFIPKKLTSYLLGAITRIELPRFLQVFVNKTFVLLAGIDMSEAESGIEAFASIEDVFTRSIQSKLRPIRGDVTSCCDGTLARLEAAESGVAVQIKGFTYSLSELVFGSQDSQSKLSYFYTTYLAPHNYHRVHSPVAGKLIRAQYFPGEFWPVNMPFVKCVPNLFSRNERLVFEIEPEFGGRVFVVMVAALNVARIRMVQDPDFLSNAHPFKVVDNQPEFEPVQLAAGDELGTFLLGSTAVVVFDDEATSKLTFEKKLESSKIILGEPMAHIKS